MYTDNIDVSGDITKTLTTIATNAEESARQNYGCVLLRILKLRPLENILSHIHDIVSTLLMVSEDKMTFVRAFLIDEIPDIFLQCHEHACPDLEYYLYDRLLQIILQYLQDEEMEVRQRASIALEKLLAKYLIDKKRMDEIVCPAIINLSNKIFGDNVEFAVQAINKMGRMASILGPEKTEKIFLDRYLELCTCNMKAIRRACAIRFPYICHVMGPEFTEQRLLSVYFELCKDRFWDVRKACAEVIPLMSLTCSLKCRKKEFPPVVLKLAKDNRKWVVIETLKKLGPFISTFIDPSITGLAYYDNGLLYITNPASPDFKDQSDPEIFSNYEQYLKKFAEENSPTKDGDVISPTESEDDDELLGPEVAQIIIANRNKLIKQIDEEGFVKETVFNSRCNSMNFDSGDDILKTIDNNYALRDIQYIGEDYDLALKRAAYKCPFEDDFLLRLDVPTGLPSIIQQVIQETQPSISDSSSTEGSTPGSTAKANKADMKLAIMKPCEAALETPSIEDSPQTISFTTTNTNLAKNNNLNTNPEKQSIDFLDDIASAVNDLYLSDVNSDDQSKETTTTTTNNNNNSTITTSSPSTIEDQDSGNNSNTTKSIKKRDKIDPKKLYTIDFESLEKKIKVIGRLNRNMKNDEEQEQDDEYFFDNETDEKIANQFGENSNIELNSSYDGMESNRQTKKFENTEYNNQKKEKDESSGSGLKLISDIGENVEDEIFNEYNSHRFWYISPEMPLDLNLLDNDGQKYSTTKKRKMGCFECVEDILLNTQRKFNPPTDFKQDVVPSSILEKFVQMVLFEEDEDMNIYCAYYFPAVALTIGRSNWHIIKTLLQFLCDDLHWKVRKIIASSIDVVAMILGRELATNDLIPIYLGFFKDLDEVKIPAIRNFANFLKVVDSSRHEEIFSQIGICLRVDSRTNWRIKEDLAKQLFLVIEMYKSMNKLDSLIYLASLVALFLEDKINCVREIAVDAMALIIQLSKKNQRSGIIDHFLKPEFFLSDNWRKRQTAAHIFYKIIKDCKTIKEVVGTIPKIPSYLLPLSNDSVPNVRWMVAKAFYAISHISSYILGVDDDVIEMFYRLKTDTDKEVSIMANSIIYPDKVNAVFYQRSIEKTKVEEKISCDQGESPNW